MKKRLVMVSLLAGFAATAQAVDGDAVIGGALGGATGAMVGSAMGGREGAIIGGAIGGAAGTAVATSERKREVVVVKDGHYRHDNGLHLGHYKQKHRHHDD